MSIKNRLNLEVSKLLRCISITAKAEEGDVTAPTADPVATSTPNTTGTTINVEDLMAKARKEEKDKLYPRIEQLEKALDSMTKSNNENLIKVATLEKDLNDKESESLTKLRKEVKDLKEKLKVAEESTVSEESIRAEIEKEYEVKFYKSEKLNELKDAILPTFTDLIDGNTVEEIDTNIEVAKTKTLETKKLLGLVDDEGNPIIKDATQTAPPKPKAMNPSDNSFTEVFNEENVRSMTREDYAKWRESKGLK